MIRIVWVIGLMGALLALSSRVAAESSDSARTIFMEAADLFDDGRYAEALTAYELSYRLNPVPVVLYNIGMCQRALDRLEDSIRTLGCYLDEGGEGMPAERRREVEGMIAEMERQLEARQRPPEPRPATPEPVVEPVAAPVAVAAPEPEPVVEPEPEPTPDREPRRGIHRQWWFWVALIGGAAAIGLGAGLGVGLSGDGELPEHDIQVNLP
jgi:hypothetical protein